MYVLDDKAMECRYQRIEPQAWTPPLVALIGTGLGRGDLSMQAYEWIDRAEILAGGSRLLDWFPEHPGERLLLQSPLSSALERLERESRTRRTAVLASGDPFFFGIGRRLVELLGKERLLTFPNISTVQSLFARLAEPWDNLPVMSLHGREEETWVRALRSHSKVALLTDAHHTPGWIAQRLVDCGIEECSLTVAEDLGLPTERIRTLPLGDVQRSAFSVLNVVVVRRESGAAAGSPRLSQPVMGLPEEAFHHQAGLITKTEIRAVVLAALQLQPGLVMWDLGAGSGSVSIEASRVAPLRKVYAVEKDPARYADLLKNIRRFQCAEIEPIQGTASEAIAGLPDPDRVFIGGSGGELEGLLAQLEARLRPGGRIVLAAVTLDTLHCALSFRSSGNLDITISQVQVNRSVPIGTSLRMEALNPVFIVSAAKRFL